MDSRILPSLRASVACLFKKYLDVTRDLGHAPFGTIFHFFTALRAMQTRSSDENSVRLSVRPSVRPSVRLSVTRVHCGKTVERSFQIYISYERTFIPLF